MNYFEVKANEEKSKEVMSNLMVNEENYMKRSKT